MRKSAAYSPFSPSLDRAEHERQMLVRGWGSSITYTRVIFLQRVLQSEKSVPGLPVRLALTIANLSDGIGHVLENFRELVGKLVVYYRI